MIRSLHPAAGVMGEPLTIIGLRFGRERGDSYVSVAGSRVTASSYLEWGDNSIRVRLSPSGEAGLVFVHVGRKRSNGVLFVDRASMPVPETSDGSSGLPVIASVSPSSASVGSVLTISGSGFGGLRGQGGVFFSAEGDPAGRTSLQVQETEAGYPLWSDREIRVRVPEGAGAGRLEVRTARGSSRPVAFRPETSAGSLTFVDGHSYVLSYSVNIRTQEARPANTLYLWVPSPVSSAAQRNAKLLFATPEPFVPDFHGTTLYRLENIEGESSADIELSWTVDVYGIRSQVNPGLLRADPDSPMRALHTASSPNLPAADPGIRALAASIVGREENRWHRARLVYRWMLENVRWEAEVAGDVRTAARNLRADAFLGSLLYATLLRAADLPARPVAGVLVNGERQSFNHHWAEFWLDGIGWIPADPAMGAAISSAAGPVPSAFVASGGEGPDFYFGNMDSNRIAFSRGFTELSRMDSWGRTVTH
ncbi:MAG: IPT/TIG domain-containing protein, partial [Treponema sp.]|nr:IPT/TIG domain-containing protein [Treponema sp.]